MLRTHAVSLFAATVLVVAACRSGDAPLGPALLTVPGGGLPVSPGTVTDLVVDVVTQTSATLSFTEVDDGLGQPARYVVRYATPPIDWSSASDVTEGTCSPPVSGEEIGARLTCTVDNLAPSTTYEFQVTAYRGTLDLLTVSGEPSNVAQGTTAVSCDCWTLPSPMPTARVGLGVATIRGVLYAVGGGANDGAGPATVDAYDPATDTWSTKSPMPGPRTEVRLAVIGGLLYAVGGTSAAATLDVYDPGGDTWTTKTPMPTPRYSPGVSAIDGVLYVVGGETGAATDHAPLATVEAYDPTTDTWTTKAPMPTARSRLAITAIDGLLYAVGGYSGAASPAVEVYDPASDTWTKKAPMALRRYGLGVGAIDGTLYAVGGWMNGPQAANEAYDPVSDTWTSKAPMPTARTALGVGVVGGVLYAIGGSNSTGLLATVEAYQP